MSIALVKNVYDETKRLATAGSMVAAGDFRLKKLLPPLEQAGAKVPVFAKVAEGVKAVVEGPEKQASQALLDLSALTSAILYTQGETGLAGTLEPVETIDLGATVVQTSARLMKSVLEALTTTGSGRLEVVKDAHERGAFKDIRLVMPALKGLEDPYSEVADYLCEKVLPSYGKAILSELKNNYDPKGKVANARRLKLMYAIDPVGTRPLVKEALENSIKEVKVAAISCLGDSPEDLSFLIEQSSAKAQDVRQAAYFSLAKIDDPAALAVFEKALAGKDVITYLVDGALRDSSNPKHAALVGNAIETVLAELPKEKDKKVLSNKIERLIRLINTIPMKVLSTQDKLLLRLFSEREQLAKYKGATLSGTDVVESLIGMMRGNTYNGEGSAVLRKALVDHRDSLAAEHFDSIVEAAQQVLTPEQMYDTFSPYFKKTAGIKVKGQKDVTEEILDGLNANYVRYYHYSGHERFMKLDPRWLDIAIDQDLLPLLSATQLKNNPKANKWLSDRLQSELKSKGKTKTTYDLDDIITVIVGMEHPQAAEHFTEAYLHVTKTKQHYLYWCYRVIPMLPKSALPKLEEIVPQVPKQYVDQYLEAIDELRRKPT